PAPPARKRTPLDLREPGEPADEEEHRDVEVDSESEDVVRGVDSQQLLPNASERVARDIKSEESGRTNAAMMAQPNQCPGQAEVPDQLVEEGRLEGGELLVAGRPVVRIDVEAPRQARRRAEELLVEVVADPADRLADEQPGCGGVHEPWDVGPA